MSIFKTVFNGLDNFLLLTKIHHYRALKVLLTKTKTMWKLTVRSTWNCSMKFLSFLISVPLSPEESSQPLTGLKYSTSDSFVLRCTGGAAWRSLPPQKRAKCAKAIQSCNRRRDVDARPTRRLVKTKVWGLIKIRPRYRSQRHKKSKSCRGFRENERSSN